MRIVGMLFLVMGLLVIADAKAALKPVWICENATGVPGAQDHQCNPEQRYVRGLNGAQPPQARELPPVSGSRLPLASVSPAIPSPPRTPSLTLQRGSATYLPDLLGDFTRAIFRMVLLLAVISMLVLALKAYVLRFGRRFVRTIMADATSVAVKSGRSHWARRSTGVAAEALRPRNTAAGSSSRTEPTLLTSPPRPTEWSLSVLRSLEWKRFEEVCDGFWKAKGYEARLTGPGSDGGVDVILAERSDSSKIFAVMQCKSWTWPVGVDKVRELWGVRDHFGAKLAIFYGLSGFTEDAKTFSAGKHLVLVDGPELLKQLLASPVDQRNALLVHVTRGDYMTPSCPQCEEKMLRFSGKEGKPDFWSCRTSKRCRSQPISIASSRA